MTALAWALGALFAALFVRDVYTHRQWFRRGALRHFYPEPPVVFWQALAAIGCAALGSCTHLVH
jgi:hypothetical protein